MKLFIAGPMRGITEFNFPAFYHTEHQLSKVLKHIVFNPAREDVETHQFDYHHRTGHESLENLGFDLRMSMNDNLDWITTHADGIVLLKDWEGSKGARAELAVARALGLKAWRIPAQTKKPYLYSLTDRELDHIMSDYNRKDAFGREIGKSNGAPASVPDINSEESWPHTLNQDFNPRPTKIIKFGDGQNAKTEVVISAVERAIADLSGDFETKVQSFKRSIGEVRTRSATGGEKGTKASTISNFPPGVIKLLMDHYATGATKYPTDKDGLPNYMKGYPYSLSIDAFARHWQAWLDGEESIPDDGSDDPTVGNHHLTACIWHLMTLLHKEITPRQAERWDDRASTAFAKREAGGEL